VSYCTNKGIGTPNFVWRDTHHSGRFLNHCLLASATLNQGKTVFHQPLYFACSRKLTPALSRGIHATKQLDALLIASTAFYDANNVGNLMIKARI